MKIAFYSSSDLGVDVFTKANEQFGFEMVFLYKHLTVESANLAEGCQAVCLFVNDTADVNVIKQLADYNIQFIALRCAGYNNVDLVAAKKHGVQVANVPSYSPESIAEHTVALILSLARRLHRAYQRTKEGNFSLKGMLGFTLSGRTAGVIGTGRIGIATCRILKGFGMRVLAFDLCPNQEVENLGVEYVDLEKIYQHSDVISLHCPATKENYHMINKTSLAKMKDGVMIINTSRGELIDTSAAIESIKSGKIGFLGLDVYKNERELFFRDWSDKIIQDDLFCRLVACSNVLVTGHQGFFTEEAIGSIVETTMENLRQLEKGENCPNLISNS